MMRIIFLIALFFLIKYETLAQDGSPLIGGGRGAAMGDASLNFQDVNAIFSNQAGLAFIDKSSASLFGEKRFMIDRLNYYSAGAALKTKKHGVYGISANYFGASSYNETRIGLAYARKLFENASIGVQFDYMGTSIEEGGNSTDFTFELGFQAKLIDDVWVAGHIFNPLRVALTENKADNLSTEIAFGAAYVPSDKVYVAVDLEKDFSHPLVVRFGVEYKIVQQLALRAGFSSNPIQNSFGIGIYIKNMRMDLASSWHSQLGFSPSMGLVFAF